MTSEEERRQNGRGMTWHSLSRVLARCKSQTNLPWQLQPSQWKPTGISNSPTRRTKPRGNQNFKEHNDNSEKKNKKKTLMESLSTIWYWLYFKAFFGQFASLYFVPCSSRGTTGEKNKQKRKHLKGENEKQKRGLSKGVRRPKSQYSRVGSATRCGISTVS